MVEDIQSEKLEEDNSMGNGGIQAAREETSVVEIPHINSHIDFVFEDQQWKLGDEQRQIVIDCDLMVQVLQVKHPTVQLHINTNFSHQKQLCMHLDMEAADGPTNRTFVKLIFDPGGHFPNSRLRSFQARENDAAAPISDVRYIVGHMWDPLMFKSFY